jgi:YfiH family protein
MIGLYCKRDISEGIDGSPETVVARLEDLLPESRIYCLNQVHEDNIVFAEDIHCSDIPEADGIISRNPDDVLCIRTADCVPVLLWTDDPPLIAAVHAGWRGLAKNIVKKAVRNIYALGAGEIYVSIGPCIGVCCYEVGPDVVNVLGTENLVYKKDSMHIDLKGVALSQALDAGVDRELVHAVDICTSCNPKEFFSYRRDGHAAGRNLSIIGGKSWLLQGLQVG